jgi:hypothetical protein
MLTLARQQAALLTQLSFSGSFLNKHPRKYDFVEMAAPIEIKSPKLLYRLIMDKQ